jgi:predicted GNAT family acetyltransferase
VIARAPGPASVLATNLHLALSGYPISGALWFLLVHEGETVALAMQTPPHNLFVTPLPAGARAGLARELADAVQERGRQVPGVTAVTPDAEAFAAAWTAATGARARPTMRERLYEIRRGELDPAGAAGGRPRLAGEPDVELAARWMRAFELEALPQGGPDDYPAVVRRRIERSWLLLWQDAGEPVAMAGTHRPSAGVSRIGPVYTPPFSRRRGYGAAVTAAATRQGFEAGAHTCVLYADLTNPTSNGIYQAIGYRPAGDALMLAFD